MPRGRRSQKKSGGHGREKDGGKHGVKRGEAERQEIALAALEVDAAEAESVSAMRMTRSAMGTVKISR